MTGRLVYTREFKTEAVRLANEGTESVSEVAKQLGIDVGSLGKWKRAAERDGGVLTPGAKAKVSSATTPSALEAELRRLRAENERLKMERDLLPLEMSIHRLMISSPPHAKHLLCEVSADAGCVGPC